MKNDTNNLIKEFIQPSFDLALDYAEIGIDEFINNSVLKEVPIIKTLIAFVKTGVAIKERFFIKKFLVFLKELHVGTLSKDEFEKFKIRFKADKIYQGKIIEHISLLIEDCNSIQKSKILAHLFEAYINGKYDYKRFIQISNCLVRLSDQCYKYIHRTVKKIKPEVNQNLWMVGENNWQDIFEDIEIYREILSLLIAGGICYVHGVVQTINQLGRDLYTYGISKIDLEDI